MAEAQTYLSKCILQKRSIYSNRTVSYLIVLLELLTVLLEYIDLSVIATLISNNSYYCTNILPIMLALCSMLSGTYYAQNYASIIGLLFRCEQHNVKLNPDKVQFKQDKLPFIGHLATKDGLCVDPQKVKAVLEMPTPTDVAGVQRLLGFA